MKNIPITKEQVKGLPLGFTATGNFENRKTRRSRPAKEMNCRGKHSLIILNDESGRQRKIKRVVQMIPLFEKVDQNPIGNQPKKIIGHKRVVHYV